MSTSRLSSDLEVHVLDDVAAVGAAAAADAVETLRRVIGERGAASVMFASGNSQLTFLAALRSRRDEVDWRRVTAFHMDEYVGLPATHPATFHRYMAEHVVEPLAPRAFHAIRGDATDPAAEAHRYAALLADHPLGLCCLGIGENGHLAFNDPPVADFDDPLTVKVVTLDDACRAQQVGEGHFPSVADVPPRAITVTIPALLAAERVLVVATESRKAEAVYRALEGPITTACPASALRHHPNATLYLDRDSAALVGRP